MDALEDELGQMLTTKHAPQSMKRGAWAQDADQGELHNLGLVKQDSTTGKPKLMSWASEMSMYDGSSERPSAIKLPKGMQKLNLQNQVSRTPPPPGELHHIAKMPVQVEEGLTEGRGKPKGKGRFDDPPPPGLKKGGSSSGKGRNSRKGKKEPVFDSQNLIINYLPPDMDSHRLRNLFSPYGNIINCKVVMDHQTGLSKGYGFVKFQQREQAEQAIKNLNGYKIGQKTLKVSTARKTSRKGGGETGPTNLYIANLDKEIDSSDLQRYFSKVGYIVQCRVLKDEKGITRRIGFVRYDNNDSALRAIKEFDGKKLDGKGSVIQVRFANTPRAPPGSQQYSSPRITPASPIFAMTKVGGGDAPAVMLSPVHGPIGDDGRLQTAYVFPTAAEDAGHHGHTVLISPHASPRQSRVFGGSALIQPIEPPEDPSPLPRLTIPRKGRPMLIPVESTPVGHDVASPARDKLVSSPPAVPEHAPMNMPAAQLPAQQVFIQGMGSPTGRPIGITQVLHSPTQQLFSAASPTGHQVMQIVQPLRVEGGQDGVQYVIQSPHAGLGGAVTLTPVTMTGQLDPTNTRNSQYSRSTACYVGGIEVDLQEADLKKAFEFDGIVVKSVRIIRRRVGPYAFVNFFNTGDAHKAAEKLNQTKLGKSVLTVRLK